MPGPTPKDPSLRQRRNKTSTAAKLTLAPSGIEPPELPQLYEERDGEYVEVEWHPRTLQWWEDVWASPMATEFLEADVHGLFLLAELEDRFHKATSTNGKVELAKEIRLQRQAFGLTPIDRRRLQWEVEKTEDARERGRKRRQQQSTPTPKPASDPRFILLDGGDAIAEV